MIHAAMAAVVPVLMLSACASAVDTPSATVKAFLEAGAANDYQRALGYLTGEAKAATEASLKYAGA
ncbi:hypothetical protein HYS54_03175 [Candidatus Micrarchaeota archaeon]|nr:hypothetical protein [Candidatus Micrarchaeota archaeon]